ncbi:MAG: GNAT family N-acetyltransferase [Bacteroidales bacterium]|nr:GNAT family N-acetyltransferase [Bacteroidales bacterium]
MSHTSDHVISFEKILLPGIPDPIKELYLNSFPPEERRTLDGLEKQLYEPGCSVNSVWISDIPAGLVVYWDFEDFLFVEHLAVQPHLRGQKTGEKIMNQITAGIDKPVLLEIEPPKDELSKRRMNFYLRLGFQLLDVEYLQPSYTGHGPGYPMKLMANNAIDDKDLRRFIAEIYNRVYKVNQ